MEAEHKSLTLSVGQAAKLLGISRAFAYELVARGELPSLRLGRRIVVPRRALEALLEAGVRRTRGPGGMTPTVAYVAVCRAHPIAGDHANPPSNKYAEPTPSTPPTNAPI